ncbi:GL14149 [Drosophila persimilis]|uniref:GL14149 n=1 Tax=Drosophila persimilis TaxID=7234 RepID=B4HD24_DROPE|nr:GL14149 [Drosophila persimilis]
MEYVHSVWNYIASVCSCLHCAEDVGAQNIEPNERTHLLVDPVNHSPALRRSNSDGLSNDYPTHFPKKMTKRHYLDLYRIQQCLLKDVPSHQFYITKPIYAKDTLQMKLFIEKALIGVNQIQIDHKEAVVVPFQIP